MTRGSGTGLGEGSRIGSGTGRGLGYQGIRDAQTWPQPSFEANEPPILLMAPKKEKPTGSTSYKIWEPSLIAALMNQVSPPLKSLQPRHREPGALLLSTALPGPPGAGQRCELEGWGYSSVVRLREALGSICSTRSKYKTGRESLSCHFKSGITDLCEEVCHYDPSGHLSVPVSR